MAPPQVNLNEKPSAETSQDPLPEKQDSPVIVTVDRRCPSTSAEQRRQRKRCRIICCGSLSFLLVLMLALGTACIVYRMKHKKKEWRTWCGTKGSERLPEHVSANHEKRLIYVRPEHHDGSEVAVLHEYNRRLIAFKTPRPIITIITIITIIIIIIVLIMSLMRLIAFKNITSKKCYLDRLDETFEEGYARWQGYEEKIHMHNHTMMVFAQKIDVQVVRHIADVHIFEHCGGKEYEYHWVKEVTEEEIRLYPARKYIRV
ncbi:hypothetical protein ACOMHN_006887 [Nucella lapillus]